MRVAKHASLIWVFVSGISLSYQNKDLEVRGLGFRVWGLGVCGLGVLGLGLGVCF